MNLKKSSLFYNIRFSIFFNFGFTNFGKFYCDSENQRPFSGYNNEAHLCVYIFILQYPSCNEIKMFYFVEIFLNPIVKLTKYRIVIFYIK